MDILHLLESNPDNIAKINSLLMDDDLIVTNIEQPNQTDSQPETENINVQIIEEDNSSPEEIVKDLLNEMLAEALDNHIYLQRYNNNTAYMKRKIDSIQNEVIKSFGAESFTYMDLKPGYSKLELAKRKSKSEQLESKPISNKENIVTNNFMSDVKVHKSRIELEKENAKNTMSNNTDTLTKKKREREDNRATESFMANAIKKKSTIEIEKEKFIEQAKKHQEELLKKKHGMIKSHVFKFDAVEKETKVEEKVEQINAPICEICNNAIVKVLQKTFPRCKHSYHNVSQSLI